MRRFALALWLVCTVRTRGMPRTSRRAAEVRPSSSTRATGSRCGHFDGQDVIYFTNLLAWRCGTAAIMYGLNDDPPTTLFAVNPATAGTATPMCCSMSENRGSALLLDPGKARKR